MPIIESDKIKWYCENCNKAYSEDEIKLMYYSRGKTQVEYYACPKCNGELYDIYLTEQIKKETL